MKEKCIEMTVSRSLNRIPYIGTTTRLIPNVVKNKSY